MAAALRRRGRGTDDDTSGPVLITSARKSYEEELAARKRNYFLLMSVRIPALLLAMIAFLIWDNGLIALAIVGASIPIPWIAVLYANDRPKRSKLEPRGYAAGSLLTTPLQSQLAPGGVVHSTPREDTDAAAGPDTDPPTESAETSRTGDSPADDASDPTDPEDR